MKKIFIDKRKDRLKSALKANIAKRKAQAKLRSSAISRKVIKED